jgi:hypothetical protein
VFILLEIELGGGGGVIFIFALKLSKADNSTFFESNTQELDSTDFPAVDMIK